MKHCTKLIILTLVVALLTYREAVADIYFYRAPDGHKVLTDRPIADKGYYLVSRRSNPQGVSSMVARRSVSTAAGQVRFLPYITRASKRYGVDSMLVEAIIQVESSYDPHAVSVKGATGLMQLMQATATQYKVRDLFDPEQNIDGGVQHLKDLMNRFKGSLPLVLAAYNAGAGSVERHRGVPPFPETERYITKVLDVHAQLRRNRLGRK